MTGGVLHIITGLERGGAEAMLVEVVLRSRETGVRQTVVTLMDGGVHRRTLIDGGIRVASLGMRRGRLSIGALPRLVRIMRQSRPGLVMTWLYHADLMGTIAARYSGTPPLVWNIRCSNMDLARYGRTTRVSVAALAKLSKLPNAVGYNSHAGRAAHEEFGYRPKEWIYLPNGIDGDRWYPDEGDRCEVRAELGLQRADIALAMVARVDPKKDHPGFLRAFEGVLRRHPEARAVLIGSGTRGLEIPATIRARVITLEDRSDVHRLLRGCDVLVSSSAFGEGFPNVIAEAMATGLPCVVTDVGDARLVVGEHGVLVRANDPDALAGGVTKLIAAGPEARRSRGEAGRQYVLGAWSMEHAVLRYQRLFAAFLKADGRSAAGTLSSAVPRDLDA